MVGLYKKVEKAKLGDQNTDRSCFQVFSASPGEAKPFQLGLLFGFLPVI